MNNFQNSKEFKEIVNYLNKKNFSKALEKIQAIYKNYPNDQIILRMLASIYFNNMDWGKAISYYEKVLFFEKDKSKILTNIGVAQFKLGKINKSINTFKIALEYNSNFDLTYNNLGIAYLELAKFEDAIKNFSMALKINKKNISAQTNLINLLTLYKPKKINENPFVKLDKHISNINIENIYYKKNLKKILNESIKLINCSIENINFNETQLFRKNSKNLNCKRHFKIFNKFNIIPKFCFSCYKIQVDLIDVIDLIKLSFLFSKLELKNNNTRKCMVETRKQIPGNYKGYIYCNGIEDAKDVLEKVKDELKNMSFKKLNLNIKHGCSEFYKSYPKFKIVNLNGKNEIKYNEKWKIKEDLIDAEEPLRINIDKKIWAANLKSISLSDILIINNWLNYAEIIGDFSYKEIFEEKINNPFLEKILINQLEFRKKNLIIN